jgi:threonine/homoserine/homoserine lactone efflux protein
VSLATLIAFAGVALLIELTPGPNMTYLAVLTVREGGRSGFAAVAGIGAGLAFAGGAALLGLAALIAETPALYQTLRWGGVAYLLWLAWEAWREEPLDAAGEGDGGAWRCFARGFATNVLNPKAYLFYLAVLPTFIGAGGSIVQQTAILTAIYVAIATSVHAAIVILADASRGLLTNVAWARKVRRALALAIAAIAVWLAWSTRAGA